MLPVTEELFSGGVPRGDSCVEVRQNDRDGADCEQRLVVLLLPLELLSQPVATWRGRISCADASAFPRPSTLRRRGRNGQCRPPARRSRRRCGGRRCTTRPIGQLRAAGIDGSPRGGRRASGRCSPGISTRTWWTIASTPSAASSRCYATIETSPTSGTRTAASSSISAGVTSRAKHPEVNADLEHAGSEWLTNASGAKSSMGSESASPPTRGRVLRWR